MLVTSQIDHMSSARLGRNFGPKLEPFLSCIKAFTPVIDTYAQSASLAALIWASVKLCLFLTSNSAEYFERLTRILMRVGERGFRFKQFGSLYPSSRGLQEALVNYYAVVVRICCKAVNDFQRPQWKQLARSAFKDFEREYQPLRENLDECAKSVVEEISLASSELQSREAQKAAEDRSTKEKLLSVVTTTDHKTTDLVLSMRHQHMWKLRESIKDNLSAIDMRSAWSHIRRQCVPETSMWFEANGSFDAWRTEQSSSLLVYSANLGYGKTYLFANVVSSLIASEGANYSIGYFLCQSKDPERQLARNVIGSIARQILRSRVETIDDVEVLQRLLEESKTDSTAILTDLIAEYTLRERRHFILVDGMDELPPKARSHVLESLAELLHLADASKIFKVFITTRHKSEYLCGKLRMNSEVSFQLQPSSEELNSSLSLYLADTLDQSLDAEELQLQDPDLIGRIFHTVKSGAQGMSVFFILTRYC